MYMYLFSMWFWYFFQLNFNKLYAINIPKVVEIMYTTYSGLSKRWLCEEYVGRGVNNVPRVNVCKILLLNILSPFHPEQWPDLSLWSSQNQHLVSSQLQKNMWPRWKALNWVCDMVMWNWSEDTLFSQLSINHNMDVQSHRYSYGKGATMFWVCVRMDRNVTTIFICFPLMGRQIFQGMKHPTASVRRPGVTLQQPQGLKNNRFSKSGFR